MISLIICWAFTVYWAVFCPEIFSFRRLGSLGKEWLLLGAASWGWVFYTAIATYGYLLN